MNPILRLCLIAWLAMAGHGNSLVSVAAACGNGESAVTESANTESANDQAVRPWSEQQIRDAFANTHDGWSTDETLVRQTRCDAFLRELGLAIDDPDTHQQQQAALLQLLKLRKTGRLNVRATRRSQVDVSPWTDTAEIAIRTVLDRHQVSIDDVMCSPRLRSELQTEAIAISPAAPADAIRKAVLQLRKVRKLRPELVLRVADWQTQVVTMRVDAIDFETLPELPGVYLFRSDEGYLYIGEAENLATRIAQHLAGSHNSGLARRLSISAETSGHPLTLELHVFAQDSPGNRVVMRRAYESELIRSREPEFNLRP